MVSENGRVRATRAPRKSDYYFSRLLPLRHLGSRQMDEWASPAPSYRFSGFRRSLEELESSGRGRGLSIDGRPTRPTMPSRRPTTLLSQGQAGGLQIQVRLPNTRENRRERRRPRAPVLLHKSWAEVTALQYTPNERVHDLIPEPDSRRNAPRLCRWRTGIHYPPKPNKRPARSLVIPKKRTIILRDMIHAIERITSSRLWPLHLLTHVPPMEPSQPPIFLLF
jgi:hypothetical protein